MSSLLLAQALRARREPIVQRWLVQERERTGDQEHSDDVLIDGLRGLLLELAGALEARERNEPEPVRRAAREHALQRWRLGLPLERITREYAGLRQVLLRELSDVRAHTDTGGWALLHEWLDHAVCECVTAYVQRQTGTLEHERQRFRVSLQRAPVMVFEQDLDLRYTWVHPHDAGTALVGHTDAELLQDRRTLGDVVQLKHRVFEQGEPAAGQVRIVQDGQERHYWLSLEPVRDRDGRVEGLVGAATDFTERVLQETELREALELREKLLGVVSHDLRNPVNAIVLSTESLLRQPKLEERQQQLLRRLRQAAQRAERLIGELLDYTRLRTSGLLPVTPAPCDLGHIAEQVMGEVSLAVPDRDLRVVRAPAADLRLDADPDRLAQLLTNLVRNALQHSLEGTRVTIRLDAAPDTVSVSVHNEGVPIPQHEQERMFEAFVQGEGASFRGGNVGLGLYIVKHILEAHRGGVVVHSTADAGTTFTVALPRAG
ncbi:PAS domain-containing protein [Corallococcus macrosporus]|uniref:histidine kinase n=1 Tax=Corallococcus macrosporus TaxID=35 RepID=A0ABS3DHE3_9BACT|nr:PAS domain-containing sensor histidine kinase [Corallococcus macrosporus]MBN8230743.1 PAS domain-containing protein [Corallococcus macrosporus]